MFDSTDIKWKVEAMDSGPGEAELNLISIPAERSILENPAYWEFSVSPTHIMIKV